MENATQVEPEQMESGKWYVIETVYLWLIKFKNITNQNVSVYKSICIDSLVKYKYDDFNQCKIQHIKSIRHATNEEVLKYFPDEKFENVSLINEVNNTQVTEQQNQKWSEKVELRPEELVSGEVYKNVIKFNDETIWEYIYEFIGLVGDNEAKYSKMINHDKVLHYNDDLSVRSKAPNVKYIKIYHATPEEKALLLGDEQTDWKSKFEELQNRYKVLVTEANKLDVLSGEMCDKYTALKASYERLSIYNDELTERINQTEIKNNQEKVYFYLDKERNNWRLNIDKQIAIDDSENHKEIYEAKVIGKKKSVLVSE